MNDRVAKKMLKARVAGPASVRRCAEVPVIGPAVRGAWRWWLRRSLLEEYRRGNAPAVSAFRADPPPLNTIQQRVLDDLRDQGLAIVAAADLFGTPDPLAQLRRAVEKWVESSDVQALERAYTADRVSGNDKSYLIRMFGNRGEIPWRPWLEMAVHPHILNVVNSYLGLHARINYIDAWDTIPLDRDGPDVGSQQWHRDPEAPALVKVFAYFTDVTPDAGPLLFIPRSRQGERYGTLWPQEMFQGSRPPASELERAIPPSEWITCTVPAGTLVFADTSAFHRGGRATRTRRVLSVVSYVPPGSRWPRRFSVHAGALPLDLSRAARAALID